MQEIWHPSIFCCYALNETTDILFWAAKHTKQHLTQRSEHYVHKQQHSDRGTHQVTESPQPSPPLPLRHTPGCASVAPAPLLLLQTHWKCLEDQLTSQTNLMMSSAQMQARLDGSAGHIFSTNRCSQKRHVLMKHQASRHCALEHDSH